MENLAKLFKVIEIARNQPRTGYTLAGIQKSQLDDVAQHQYLVTFIAWQLALYVQKSGAKIDVLKVLEIALVHDIGELLGGDISFHYGRAHPVARQAAKAFEKENIIFLSQLFENPKQLLELSALTRGEVPSDEAIISRFADLLEASYYKQILGKLEKQDIGQTTEDLQKRLSGAKDPVVKEKLAEFLTVWSQTLLSETATDIIWSLKG